MIFLGGTGDLQMAGITESHSFPIPKCFSWTSRGSHFGAGKTTSWVICTDFAPTGATRKIHLVDLFSILARFSISSFNFRQCHSLVSPRGKLIMRQIVTTWEFPFLTSSFYSNTKWKITRFPILQKLGIDFVRQKTWSRDFFIGKLEVSESVKNP